MFSMYKNLHVIREIICKNEENMLGKTAKKMTAQCGSCEAASTHSSNSFECKLVEARLG